MIAIFYDRKNKCEVKSDQMELVNVLLGYAAVDDGGFGVGTPTKVITDKYGDECLRAAARTVAEIGYKSPACPSYCNWDLYCMQSDLIFLRLVE